MCGKPKQATKTSAACKQQRCQYCDRSYKYCLHILVGWGLRKADQNPQFCTVSFQINNIDNKQEKQTTL